MNRIKVGGLLDAPQIVLGCMRIASMEQKEVAKLINTAIECGIDYFDHADIYGGGSSETLFGNLLKETPSLRGKITLQSKCGIRKNMFDFSKEHIISSVDGSLSRLNTEYLDVLLLHRPDTLMEPEEVADAFLTLKKAGKVRYFGVSNQNGGQMALIQKYFPDKLIANQLQISITESGMIDAGLNVNMKNAESINHDGGILEYCRLNDITIQPWSPFQYGFFEGTFLNNPKFPELNKTIDDIAKKYDVTAGAVVIAWLLRHPAKMQPIIGSTDCQRVKETACAADFTLTREEWYQIYLSSGKKLP